MNTQAQTVPKKSFKIQMLAARETAIIQSVNRLLAEKGFDAMTVDEVAAEVGQIQRNLQLYLPFSVLFLLRQRFDLSRPRLCQQGFYQGLWQLALAVVRQLLH